MNLDMINCEILHVNTRKQKIDDEDQVLAMDIKIHTVLKSDQVAQILNTTETELKHHFWMTGQELFPHIGEFKVLTDNSKYLVIFPESLELMPPEYAVIRKPVLNLLPLYEADTELTLQVLQPSTEMLRYVLDNLQDMSVAIRVEDPQAKLDLVANG